MHCAWSLPGGVYTHIYVVTSESLHQIGFSQAAGLTSFTPAIGLSEVCKSKKRAITGFSAAHGKDTRTCIAPTSSRCCVDCAKGFSANALQVD
jgi:hypothetical protein